MIRKAIIVVLIVASTVTLMLYAVSCLSPKMFHPLPTRQISVTDGTFWVGYTFPSDWFPGEPVMEMSGRFDFLYISFGPVKVVTFPLWLPLLLFSIYPLVAVLRGPGRRRRHRREQGLCLECGYDLTGNESGVCPECGDTIETP